MGPNALFSFIGSSKRKALYHLSNFGALTPAVYQDYVGAVGRRAGASFFARHPDYFIVTRNSQPLPGLGTLTQLLRDPLLRGHLTGLAKNEAPRRRRHLIKPPGRYC